MAKGLITIVGLDPIGIALAQAVKQARPNALVAGVDADPRRVQAALKVTPLDRNDTNVAAAARDADLIILNVPPSELREAFKLIGPNVRDGAVVLDLTPIKAAVQDWAAEFLPSTVRHMSCHLVLHPEVDEWRVPGPDLFHGAVLCMAPTADTDETAIKSGSDLAKIIGARPYFMDVHEHDGLLAAVEGMPGLVSAAVLMAATHARSWPELSQVAGAVFAQATRSTQHSALDFGAALAYNRADVLRWLDAFLGELRDVRQAVSDGDVAKLNEWLDEAIQRRAEWLAARPIAPWSDENAMPSPPSELKRMDPLMPGWGRKS
ncbi:MAG: prephenate dehydrogenase [Thermoflexales bacterium]|nr:prephenate dehydrogenase [Thermoflexales bacterium]